MPALSIRNVRLSILLTEDSEPQAAKASSAISTMGRMLAYARGSLSRIDLAGQGHSRHSNDLRHRGGDLVRYTRPVARRFVSKQRARPPRRLRSGGFRTPLLRFIGP